MNELIRELAIQKSKEVIERREEILTAFIAKYGYEPDEIIMCDCPSTGKFWVEKKNKWISVKDRLPSIGEQVLAFGLEPENIHDQSLPFKTGIYDGKNWISDHFCESSYIEVTHWMPLPEPPK